MQTPLVSIIIPTYNRAYIIDETLASVQGQTYQNWECIIVDDGSTDNTEELIQEWLRDERFKFYKRHREPKGAPTCRNIGLEKALGELILFFDSDDLMYQDMLQTFLREFQRAEHLKYLACEADFFQSNKLTGSTSYFLLDENIESYLGGYGFMAPSFILKREIFSKIGNWNETLLRLQDVDFFSRLFFYNIAGTRVKKNLFKVRIHDSNITSKWNEEICKSLIQAHLNLGNLYSKRASGKLKVLIGKRVTAFSISALASGFWRVSFCYFFKGLSYLPTRMKLNRFKLYVSLLIKKPFIQNERGIILYE